MGWSPGAVVKTILLYIHVAQDVGQFMPYTRRFLDTYVRFPAGIDHELHLINNNGPLTPEVIGMFDPYASAYHRYTGTGFDIGAQQRIVQILNCDFLVCTCSTTYFKREGWLRRFVEARLENGEGLYGSHASFQVQPHIRTCFYGLNPERLRQYPWPIQSKSDTYGFEHGHINIVQWMRSVGLPSYLVTWDGCYEMARWRTPPNIFRRGDQSNCLSFDRHSDAFENSDPYNQALLAGAAGG